ncbi:hypothetical protein [Microbacterium sp. gxy059]|uniref:hypothetical protein n=1 Tax=Microbacterium sp. gxy059 TaxID=2957199 RepID=UPI003D99E7FF
MAIGGRSRVATGIGGVLIAGVVGLLVWAAWPFWPVVGDWMVGLVDGFFEWLRSVTPARRS